MVDRFGRFGSIQLVRVWGYFGKFLFVFSINRGVRLKLGNESIDQLLSILALENSIIESISNLEHGELGTMSQGQPLGKLRMANQGNTLRSLD